MVHKNIVRYLTDLGWPAAMLVDSGNGYHILYKIDLPTNDDGIVKNILRVLDQKFTCDTAKVDTTVYNASRIAKVPGTSLARVRMIHSMVVHIVPARFCSIQSPGILYHSNYYSH